MIPAPFEYSAPKTLEDALRLLERHGDEAKILAGGHSLLPLIKLRRQLPAEERRAPIPRRCSACPNSWNSVCTSSCVKSAGRLLPLWATGAEKLHVM